MKSYPEDYIHCEDESIIKWNDKRLGIEWPINTPIVKGRDR